jgi:hypothetical protein
VLLLVVPWRRCAEMIKSNGQRYVAMLRINSDVGGDYSAIEWLAYHVGELRAGVDELRKKVARIERKQKKREEIIELLYRRAGEKERK